MLPVFVFPSEYYVTMVKWVTPERLSVRWVNRAQNTSILSLCNVTIGDGTKVRKSPWRHLHVSDMYRKFAVAKLCLVFCFRSFRNTWWHQRSGLIVRWVHHFMKASLSLIGKLFKVAILFSWKVQSALIGQLVHAVGISIAYCLRNVTLLNISGFQLQEAICAAERACWS